LKKGLALRFDTGFQKNRQDQGFAAAPAFGVHRRLVGECAQKPKNKGDMIMPNGVYYVSYKLKKGASVPDFLLASETLNNEHISKQKGYISWKQLNDGETWADFCTFETLEDVKNFEESSGKNPNGHALKFYSFINLNSCRGHFFTVEKNYGDTQ